MSLPREDGGRRPSVYARLAHDTELQLGHRTPPGWSRWAGWLLCLAIAVAVVMAVLQVDPW